MRWVVYDKKIMTRLHHEAANFISGSSLKGFQNAVISQMRYRQFVNPSAFSTSSNNAKLTLNIGKKIVVIKKH